MASPAFQVRVDAFQSEPRISIVVETFGAPFDRRSVTSIAQVHPLPPKLAAMFVAMA